MLRICLLALTVLCSTITQAQREGFVQIPEGKIFYRTFGSGKPLLIINGGPGMNSDGFTDLAKTLATDRMTVLFDQRGTGKSGVYPVNLSTITMQAMVDDMERLRKELKIKSWTILGHSFGGMLASYYAIQFPQNIDALILSSSGGIDLELLEYAGNNINRRLSKEETDSLAHWNARINNGDTSYFARLQRGRFLAPAYVYNRKLIPAIAERLTQGNQLINGLVWQDLQRINFDCKRQLSTFTKPVLIIQGKQDIIDKKTAEKAHKIFINSKMVFMDECVHYGWLDQPVQYFSEVNQFLAALK